MRVVLDGVRLRATVELSFDAVEFIGTELPQHDGFTRDWWECVWKPLLEAKERLDAEAEAHRMGLSD